MFQMQNWNVGNQTISISLLPELRRKDGWRSRREDEIMGFLDHMKTVDAVPVIRCKDCKHWACDDSESYCDELGIFNTDMNSYCSYAKRKEE